MLTVISRAQTAPEHRAELVAAARVIADATRTDEGCRSYGFFADLFDENSIVGIEIWRERTDLDAHMTHEHTRRFLDQFPNLVIGEPDVVMHESP